jgi:hypothetical protein
LILVSLFSVFFSVSCAKPSFKFHPHTFLKHAHTISFCYLVVNFQKCLFCFLFFLFCFSLLYILLKNSISAAVSLLISALVHCQVYAPYIIMDM